MIETIKLPTNLIPATETRAALILIDKATVRVQVKPDRNKQILKLRRIPRNLSVRIVKED